MQCCAIPYEGREPYIFFSYSHKDADRVYPLLEQMVRDGYRVWYDDGNHPGDDWLENIGEHLNNCRLCLAMMSQNSEESHNCKKEVSFAVQCNKTLLAVMLEKFAMTVGMRLQLSTIHYLVKTDYSSDKALLEKLYEADGMKACRAEPGSLRMRDIPIADNKKPAAEKHKEVVETFVHSDITYLPEEVVEAAAVEKVQAVKEEKQQGKTLKIKAKAKIKAVKKETDAVVEELPAVEENEQESALQEVPLATATSVQEKEETVLAEEVQASKRTSCEENTASKEKSAEEKPQPIANGKKLLLLRVADGSTYLSDKTLIQLGRSEKRCDVVLKNNHLISNYHADIIVDDDICYLRDAGSSNGTFFNGEKLQPGIRIRLGAIAKFQICKEDFMLFFGESVEKSQADRKVVYLQNPKTKNIRMLSQEVFLLDRQHKWEDGSLSNGNISRKHARICFDTDGYYLEDLGSKNGTFHNEQKIVSQTKRRLKNGDRIRLVDTVLEFNIVTF